jgi:hypothetical protein
MNEDQNASNATKQMVYLAAPYSNMPNKKLLMDNLCKVDARLMQDGIFTVSPLMKHFILHHDDLPGDWNYWGNYSEVLLERCDCMIVVMFDGWKESIGVQEEIKLCRKNNIPIVYFDPDTMTFV